jgi:tight adherence protein B
MFFGDSMRRLGLAALLLALALTPATASADDPVSGAILDIDDRAFPEVRTVLTLADAGGRPVTGLTPGMLLAEETGRSATVTRIESVVDTSIGVAVVLTIDVSGSMQGAPINQARAAAGAFVQSLQPVDQAAVISFGNQVAVREGVSADRNATLAAISGLNAAGNTALYSAVAESVNVARAATLPRKAIILLSDGLDFGGVSRTTRDQALAAAAEARIPIYAIGLGADIDRAFLEALARQSGGAFLVAPDPSTIPALYAQLSQLLRSQYIVTLRSNAPADLADRSLFLRVASGAGALELRADYKTRRTIAPLPGDVPSAPEPAPEPVPEQAADGGSSLALIALLALVGIGGALGWARFIYVLRRNRRLAEQNAALSRRAAGELTLRVEAEAAPVVAEHLVSLKVEGPEGERSFVVRAEPVTIGTGSACQVRLTDGAIAEEQARVWLREGKLVFHQLSRQHASRIAGQPVSWVILNDGDEVEIGDYKLRVEA